MQIKKHVGNVEVCSPWVCVYIYTYIYTLLVYAHAHTASQIEIAFLPFYTYVQQDVSGLQYSYSEVLQSKRRPTPILSVPFSAVSLTAVGWDKLSKAAPLFPESCNTAPKLPQYPCLLLEASLQHLKLYSAAGSSRATEDSIKFQTWMPELISFIVCGQHPESHDRHSGQAGGVLQHLKSSKSHESRPPVRTQPLH